MGRRLSSSSRTGIGLPLAHHQGLAEGGQVPRQLRQGLGGEGPVAARGIGLGPEPRLGDVEGQHRPAPGRGGQGRMVEDPQVPLEPDDLDGGHEP